MLIHGWPIIVAPYPVSYEFLPTPYTAGTELENLPIILFLSVRLLTDEVLNDTPPCMPPSVTVQFASSATQNGQTQERTRVPLCLLWHKAHNPAKDLDKMDIRIIPYGDRG